MKNKGFFALAVLLLLPGILSADPGIKRKKASGGAGTPGATGATGPAGASGISTFTWTLGSGGDVFMANTTRIPISGVFGAVSRSTINIIGAEAFLGHVSTNQATMFQLGISSPNAVGDSFVYRMPKIVVSTGQSFSGYVSTGFPLFPDEIYALHITTIPITPPLPSEYKLILHGWVNPNYP